MKKLVVLLMVGFLCPAKGFSQGDSVNIVKQVNLAKQLEQLDKKIIEAKKALHESEVLKKQKRSVFVKLMDYISDLKRENRQKTTQLITKQFKDNEGIKAENINEPIEEISIPDGTDSIRGGFIYRLLHKNAYILKPYKIVNDEKIYLD